MEFIDEHGVARRRRPVRARGRRRAARVDRGRAGGQVRPSTPRSTTSRGSSSAFPSFRLLGLPRNRASDLMDDLARRPGRHGTAGREAAATYRRLKLKLGGARRPRRRACSRRPRRDRPAAQVDVNEGGRSTRRSTRSRSSRRSASSTASSRSAPATRAARAEGAFAGPDLRRRGLPHTRRRRGVRRDRPRHQHQAREVGRDP